MKKYSKDIVKFITLAIVTPVLVMAYTKVEKVFSVNNIVKREQSLHPGVVTASPESIKKSVSENNVTAIATTKWPMVALNNK